MTYAILMRALDVADEVDLTKIWHELARMEKKMISVYYERQ